MFSFVFIGCNQPKVDLFKLYLPEYLPADTKQLLTQDFSPTLKLQNIKKKQLVTGQSDQIIFYLEYYLAEPKQAIEASDKNHFEADWQSISQEAKTFCQVREIKDIEFEECFLFYNKEDFYLFGSIVEYPRVSIIPQVILPKLFLTN